MAGEHAIWSVPRATATDALGAAANWHALGQSWRATPEPDFRPARARLAWRPEALICDVAMEGGPPRNRATAINQPTWELGDVAELFLGANDPGDYLEIHVTPENQRLQLRFPATGVADLRRGRARLEEFTFAERGIVSAVETSPDRWTAHLEISPTLLRRPTFAAGDRFRVAVCRYDCPAPEKVVVSSTAPLRAMDFHRRTEWNHVILAP